MRNTICKYDVINIIAYDDGSALEYETEKLDETKSKFIYSTHLKMDTEILERSVMFLKMPRYTMEITINSIEIKRPSMIPIQNDDI